VAKVDYPSADNPFPLMRTNERIPLSYTGPQNITEPAFKEMLLREINRPRSPPPRQPPGSTILSPSGMKRLKELSDETVKISKKYSSRRPGGGRASVTGVSKKYKVEHIVDILNSDPSNFLPCHKTISKSTVIQYREYAD
jgi:hypothetical protein